MEATTTTAALSMNLLINRKAQRVLFAEASKDIVDFLFSLLALPVATAVKLVGKDAMVGCIGNLYASVDELHSTFVQPGAAKDALLCPTVVAAATASYSSLLCLTAAEASSGSGPPKTLYRCSSTSTSKKIPTRRKSKLASTGNSDGCTYVTDAYGAACPACGCCMMTEAQYVPSAASSDDSGQVVVVAQRQSAAEGFVQGIVTYTVLDDLTVTPMSAISGITLLNTFAVRDLGDLQEKTVQLGYKEGLAILKASLQSKTVLTDVFLHVRQGCVPGRSCDSCSLHYWPKREWLTCHERS